MDVCTIVSRRDVARVRVLATTLGRREPDMKLTVLALDVDPRRLESVGATRVLSLGELAGDGGRQLAAGNPSAALATALMPLLLGTLLDDGAPTALFIGPGQRVIGPLQALRHELASHDVTLVARVPGHAQARPTLDDRQAHGAISRTLFGVRAGTTVTRLLDEWPRFFLAPSDASEAAGDETSAVQAWFDGIPVLDGDITVLRHPGFGADVWSVAELPPDADPQELTIEGLPVSTFDFSGMNPHAPLSVFAGRVSLARAPALVALAKLHSAELLEQGYERDVESHDPFDRLDGGIRLTSTQRRLFVEGIEQGALSASPFSAAGRAAFIEYLAAPAASGRSFGLTRLHVTIWKRRSDLQEAYPHLDGPDGPGFAGWLCRYGPDQEGLGPDLLPPHPDRAIPATSAAAAREPLRWGVNLVGFLTAELGMGEAARGLLTALDARDVPVMPIQGHLMPPSQRGVELHYARPHEAVYAVNVVCINGDGIPVFAREAGHAFFDGRYTIACWWWEVGEPYAAWQRGFEFVDEVWVSSQHVYELIAPLSPVPVLKMTMPVVAPRPSSSSRAALGMPENGFVFLFVHDYNSVAARKNPLGVVEAFVRAFRPGAGAKLVIKSINADRHPVEHERVALAAATHPDVTLLDRYVEPREKDAMIAQCDCYVSLHRSEGFGLTVAEAMLLAKPVVATRFGGTLEFTTDQNAYLVDYHPAAVGDDGDVYAADATWAEPDLDMAARHMREVFIRPEQARARAELGRRQVSRSHSPTAAGEAMEHRLRRIHTRMTDAASPVSSLRHPPPSAAAGGYPEQLGHFPEVDWGTGARGRLRLRINRPVAHWVRDYLRHQSSIDAEIFDRLASVDAQIRELVGRLSAEQQARHAELVAELRRIRADLADEDDRHSRDA